MVIDLRLIFTEEELVTVIQDYLSERRKRRKHSKCV